MATSSAPLSSYYADERENTTSWDTHYQRRGRNREVHDYINSSSGGGHRSNYDHNPQHRPRRSLSADSRPQYQTKTNQNTAHSPYGSLSQRNVGPSHIHSDRAQSDVGATTNSNSIGFYQLPGYGGVVHDDTVLYSSGGRRRLEEQQQQRYSTSQRVLFAEGQHNRARKNARENAMSYQNDNGRHQYSSSYEDARQYYDFAKDNLVTFGRCDEPTESTGFSQEELLQRKRREDTWQQRRGKRSSKANKQQRIISFPSSLLKRSGKGQAQSAQSQRQYQSGYGNEDTANNGRGDGLYSNSNSGRNKGARSAVVRRHRDKIKRLQMASCYSASEDNSNSSDSANDTFDRFMEDPNLLPANAKNGMVLDSRNVNLDRDYLSVPIAPDRSTPSETTPKSRRNTNRPTYSDFTPTSDYTPQNFNISKREEMFTKDTSPTSVMNLQVGNAGGVRWNKNLTQQEYILSPQQTKLNPDSDHSRPGSSGQKPKSILRGRHSSSYNQNGNVEGGAIDPSNDFPFVDFNSPEMQSNMDNSARENSIESFQNPFPDDPFKMDFFDENERSISPIQTDTGADNSGKFPESYVNFIEAVASVVIQTKIRQKLARNKVQKLRNDLRIQRATGSSGTNMTPMVRKSYDLARKLRNDKKMKERTRRGNAALDFYTLAAIQIQAAFRGWWVRDCLGVDNYCATMIQKEFRGMLRRREYLYDLYNIVLVQSICRRWLATDTTVTRIYCIVRIQAFARGFLVRKRVGFDLFEKDVYDAAATMIQTQWRAFACEMKFLRAYEDILVVQSIARGWITRRYLSSSKRSTKARTFRRVEAHSRFKRSKAPSKLRNDFSPAYSNHVAFMTKTLSPVRKPKDSLNRPSSYRKAWKPPHTKEDNFSFRDHQETFNTNNFYGKAKKAPHTKEDNASFQDQQETLHTNKQNSVERKVAKHGSTSRDQAAKKLDDKRVEPEQVKSHEIELNKSKARAVIERRRKERELEMRANEVEEQRRNQSHAADMAEISLRRKSMALKAEARKKQEVATTQNSVTGTIEHAKPAKGISDSSKESLFSKRMRDLETPKSVVSSTKTDSALTGKRNVTISGDKLRPNRPASKTMDAKDEVIQTSGGQKTSDKKSSADAKPMQPKSKSKAGNQAGKSKYQDLMQSLRSESEQKRIDEMHNIFRQAGLMSRAKRTTVAQVHIDNGTNL
ncbi:unnamed protein product [Pseudo-nitzschia multistriata]|uniref:Uncharacterized protein n=1 Tax=Pseudo-nitzschia multistriata TaxID=183589 RepID=A0A448Z4J7_9STRA|nr:unnamed protein product [Pseudo-nitzschia multistriata]